MARLLDRLSGRGFLRITPKTETNEQQEARIKENAKKAADGDKAIDAMVRKSIKLHGP